MRVRASAKEPGNILYFPPAATAIVNVQDRSFTLTPEVICTGFTNGEFRGRVVLLQGARYTDFGERQYVSDQPIHLEFRVEPMHAWCFCEGAGDGEAARCAILASAC